MIKLEERISLGAILFKCIRQNAIMELLAYSVKAMDVIIIVIAMMAIAVCTLSANNAQNHHISLKWIINLVTLSTGFPITELRLNQLLRKQNKMLLIVIRKHLQVLRNKQLRQHKNKQLVSPKHHHKQKKIYRRLISAIHLLVTLIN